MKMPLQFDINIVVPKNADQSLDSAARAVDAAMFKGKRERPIITSSQADQTCGIFLKFIFENCAFIFRSAQLHSCDQSAKGLITNTRRNQKRKARGITDFRFQIADFASCFKVV